jgi:peptidoglycan hydrolase-like protein with peptidoglycan-binding domain
MGVFLNRLVFLAFIGLTGFIVYNALYLQEQRSAALMPSAPPSAALAVTPEAVAQPSADPAKLPAVTTDLPPAPGQEAPTQLVTAIQRELAARGYGSGQADGTLSLQTRKAIADFEKDHGLPPTGKPSDELLRHILLGDADPGAASTGAVTVASNSGNDTKQSPPVKADATIQHVQQILADLGYAPGPVDGAMGTETERAVSAFQRDRKIAATGTITPELLREIKLVTGRELASETSTR